MQSSGGGSIADWKKIQSIGAIFFDRRDPASSMIRPGLRGAAPPLRYGGTTA
jgi:hypothetical protein